MSYKTALQNYFRRHADRRDEPEDLAQEVYRRLLQADRTELAAVANEQAYLFTVASNLLRERAFLHSRTGAFINLTDHQTEFLDGSPSPEDAAERKERDRKISAVIADLPTRYRAVIIMYYQHDMTYEQIAARIGVTAHAVKKNLTRARLLCRSALLQAGLWP